MNIANTMASVTPPFEKREGWGSLRYSYSLLLEQKKGWAIPPASSADTQVCVRVPFWSFV